MNISLIHASFYKNKLYKNTEAEICLKIKNKLRTIKLVTFTDAVLTVSSFFFCIRLDEKIANMYFLAPFYFSGQLIHC